MADHLTPATGAAAEIDLVALREAGAGAAEATLPRAWREPLAASTESPSFLSLLAFLVEERRQHTVFPPPPQVYEALARVAPAEVRVVLLGQDPYHDDGQAHGLAFSVPRGVAIPPSLRNIFRELESDLGLPYPAHGCLDKWAAQGVLLLNTILTVRAHEAGSHRDRGWEPFTDAVIDVVARGPRPLVFLLFGAAAQKKAERITAAVSAEEARARHVIIETPHPSPLSAHGGFFGSRPFSAANAALTRLGEKPIDWSLED